MTAEQGARGWSDHRLVTEMRARDSSAFEEFFERFAPLLREEASQLRIQPAHREEAVVRCLEDGVLALIKEPTVMPASLAAELLARLATDNAVYVTGGDRKAADRRALRIRASLTPREVSQTASDAVKFGKQIRTRLGQRRAP
jgi:hypothetical protein